ncbi:MAG: 4Fe-4S cluster-binding domain-containing protein, partial [Clostridia bacterium]|nr:4Fe-4S cluster-binding domain-containing protein [Clostridia bacterium]
MIHLFRMHGDRLAFDPQTGALHTVDETAYQVLEEYDRAGGVRPAEPVLADLAARLGEGVSACADEVDGLIRERLLFAPAAPVPDLSVLYPDRPRIKSMCLHAAHDCNLRCRYCFAGTGDYGTGSRCRMDLDTGRKAVDFLIRESGPRRNLDIDFFGGEPLLNWPVVTALTEYCEKRGAEEGKNIRLTITTNATLLDADKTEFINRHMKNCVLSLDGRPETHDRMRPDAGGRGSYDKVAASIRRFVEERGEREHYVRGTFTRHNLDFSKDVLHIASLGVRQISVEPVVAPDGCGYELRAEDLLVIREEYDRLALAYVEARASGPDRWFNYFHFMIDLDGGPCAY